MWSLPEGPPVLTVYFQGMLGSEASAARYTDQYEASNGELVRCPRSLPLLYRPFVGKELDEVRLDAPNSFSAWLNWLTSGASEYQFLRSADQSLKAHATRQLASGFGQEDDIIEHAQKMALVPADHDAVLFGYSRGAAATFCALAHYHYPRVRLVVLESVPYSFEDNLQRLGYLAAARQLIGQSLFSPGHRNRGPNPGAALDRFPRVPVALIGSKDDSYVHIESQRRLAQELANLGHEVYMLELEHGGHWCVLSPSSEDRRQYCYFLHALYRRLALPHIEPFADQGAVLLELCRLR